MNFETWCETQAAFNAGAAEMREPMECGHPKACFGVKGSLLSEDDIFKAKPTCRWCAELAALKAERDKLRETLQKLIKCLNTELGTGITAAMQSAHSLIASAPKEES